MADYRLIHGDALDVLRGMADNSVDAIVADPPGALSFMGKSWDSDKGGRTQWVAWLAEIMRESLRVIKPGGHGLIWSLPRTSHWTACALEDAGWEVRDRLTHIFGSGFPKSQDIGKAIDRMAGAEREAIGRHISPDGRDRGAEPHGQSPRNNTVLGRDNRPLVSSKIITAPATDAAKEWDGWGSALKPSVEDWWLCRKPLSEPSIAANVLRHGVGGLNIDACRVATDWATDPTRRGWQGGNTSPDFDGGVAPIHVADTPGHKRVSQPNNQGRFPSHLLLSHHPSCVRRGEKRVRGSNFQGHPDGRKNTVLGKDNRPRDAAGYADADGRELVADYLCADGCPVAALDEQAGVRKSGKITRGQPQGVNFQQSHSRVAQYDVPSSEGPASRFFTVFEPDPDALFVYAPKASRSDRSSNGAVNNTHPTAKSTQLGRWLSRLICPVGGTILDPFAGSGSLGVSAILEGFNWIGIDESAEYIAIAAARLAWAANQRPTAEQLTLTV